MSTTRRFTRTGAAALVVAAPVAIAVLIAQPADEVTSAEPVSGIPAAVGSDFPRHEPGQDQDCWGPDMMDPDCRGGQTTSPGHSDQGYWGPGMMGPGMIGSGPWGPGYGNP